MFKHVTHKTFEARILDENILEKKIENLEEEIKKLKSSLYDLKMKFGDIATDNETDESCTALGSNFTDSALVTPVRKESGSHENDTEGVCTTEWKNTMVDGHGDSSKKSKEQGDSLVHVGLSSFPSWSFKTP